MQRAFDAVQPVGAEVAVVQPVARAASFILETAEGEHLNPSRLLEWQLQQFELELPRVVLGRSAAVGLQQVLFIGEAEFDSEGGLLRQLAQFELDFPGAVAASDFTIEHDLQEPVGKIVGARSEWEMRETTQKAQGGKGRPVFDTGCRQSLRKHSQAVCWCSLVAWWCLLCASCVPFACFLPACSAAWACCVYKLPFCSVFVPSGEHLWCLAAGPRCSLDLPYSEDVGATSNVQQKPGSVITSPHFRSLIAEEAWCCKPCQSMLRFDALCWRANIVTRCSDWPCPLVSRVCRAWTCLPLSG